MISDDFCSSENIHSPSIIELLIWPFIWRFLTQTSRIRLLVFWILSNIENQPEYQQTSAKMQKNAKFSLKFVLYLPENVNKVLVALNHCYSKSDNLSCKSCLCQLSWSRSAVDDFFIGALCTKRPPKRPSIFSPEEWEWYMKVPASSTRKE